LRSDDAANLKTLIAISRQNADMYRTWAAEAPNGSAAVRVLHAVAARETASASPAGG
jgi:hypothetical protein